MSEANVAANTPAPKPAATEPDNSIKAATARASRILTADQILGMDDLNILDVEIPEWSVDGEPGIIRLKTMSAREALNFQRNMNNSPKQREDAMINLVVLSAVDEKGERIFNAKQVELLRDKSIKVFTRLQKSAMELNGFAEPDNKVAKGN